MMLTPEIEAAASTLLPDGESVPVFASENGRKVFGIGDMTPEAFVKHANTVLEAYGQPPRVQQDCVLRRYALVILEQDGSLTIQWNIEDTWERISAFTPGAILVTLTEL